ncbi:winged helix-turn-helix transcriptional regulator [Allosaccharopolyspora coralli]|uniref:Winged helix-turn-helix transcriptional regulator n=1 Tax=Allosaccharopolyspora coralli TaxID=2665642 RepID=A0A5Q3Q6Z8_9PSEU|nr:Lrp/AsnC family transcriptional regulator [Allosaccharopolyspora coralli]QGK70103.1 winged helix-turn-helix transcriptional regulator [Allosaccharopolyspora coralli]
MAIRSSGRGGSGQDRAGRPAPGRDELDNTIIEELTRDGRQSVRALAGRLNLSRSSVHARVERLVQDGVVAGFSARIDPAAAGLGTSAFVGLSIEQNAWREVSARLAAMRHVEHVTLISGEFDVLVLVRTEDNASLRDLVFHDIQSLPGVTASRTWLIFDEFDMTHPPLH